MTISKLFIFEGIPGSGKTTTAKWLADSLSRNGEETLLFLERNPDHPADFESVACLTVQQLKEVEKDFPDILTLAQKKEKWFFIPYACFFEKEPELYKALQKYDVYELSVEDFCEVTVKRWEEFAQRAQNEDKVYVLECCFLQNPITFLLAKHNVKEEYIFKHITRLSNIIANLNPIIFYFEQDNIKESLSRVRKERSIEWFEFLTWYYTEQAYGKNQEVNGEEGVIQFLEERKKLEKVMLANLSIKSLQLNNSQYDWDLCKQKILDYFLIVQK